MTPFCKSCYNYAYTTWNYELATCNNVWILQVLVHILQSYLSQFKKISKILLFLDIRELLDGKIC